MKNDNKWKLFLRSFKSHLTRNIIIFLALALWFLYSDFWGSLITTVLVNPFASKLHGIYWDIIFLLIVLLLLFYYIFLVWRVEKFVNKKRLYFSFVITILVSSCLFFPSYTQFWKFHYLFGGLCPYAYIFFVPFLSELFRSIYLYLKRKSDETIYKGLEFEKPINVNSGVDSYRRGGYANSVSDLLVETFDNEFAYAVGITGEWGSGKTSFVNQIKNALTTKKLEIEVIDFKPWFCKTSSSIIDDFFTIYEQCISYYSPGTCRLLRKYAYSLSCLKETNIGAWINFAVYCLNNKDLQTQYENISKELSQAKVKTIVFIDDLDRLDKDEIMEVFRLIRNTANFPYLQFVVAYDKEYITLKMSHFEKDKAEQYLRKIFNTEIVLPQYEKRLLLECLQDKIKDTCFDLEINLDDEIKAFLDDQVEKYLFTIFLSMRDVIRFTNSFKINLSAINNVFNTNIQNEISIRDFFILEIIRYNDLYVYNTLRDNFSNLLKVELETDTVYYKLIEDVQKDEYLKSNLLLKKIFFLDKQNINRISLVNCYFKYFSYRNEVGSLLISEILFWATSKDGEEIEILKKWQNDNISNYSIVNKVNNYLLLIDEQLVNKEINFECAFFYDFIIKLLPKLKEDEELKEFMELLLKGCLYHYIKNCRMVTEVQTTEIIKLLFLLVDLFGDQDYFINLFGDPYANLVTSFFAKIGINDNIKYLKSVDYKVIFEQEFASCNSVNLIWIINKLPFKYPAIEDSKDPDHPYVSYLTLKKRQIDLLDDYLKSSDINMKKALHLTYYCVERIEEGTSKVIVNSKALQLIHNYILNNPEKYIANFVENSSNNDNPALGGYLFPEPFWNQIFGDKDKLEEFLFNPKYNRFSNIDKARNLWRLYKSNGFENVEFYDGHYYLDFLNNDGKEVMAAFKVLIGLNKELDDLKAKFNNSKIDKIELTSQLDDLNKRQKEVTLYIKLNGDVARKIKELELTLLNK